ncbi:MAG: glycosyltransferase family 2 protein, partial [Candidatus Hydrogenedentes bacterium]|nr:glycosyltransferase family 2 protein [Candidatus Hydrogenedentota bacterium]
ASVLSLGGLPITLVSLGTNRGKGHALLAGFRKALEWEGVRAVAVLDADGQHNPSELPRLYEAFQRDDASLVIGARQFDQGHVPWRSRFGNTLTVRLTGLLLGRRLPDTQCGFRLLARPFVQEVLGSVAGGRYETEMEIVVKAIREGYTVSSVPIATIYEAGNVSSHFHKVRDSFLIYTRLLRACARRRQESS